MREKSTGNLSQELMSQPNLDQYITENETYFTDLDISAFLMQLYEKCSLSKAELARQAEMSEVYLHQVFSGRRDSLCATWILALRKTSEIPR